MKINIFISLLILFHFTANSQEGMVASGGSIISAEGSASFSIGQIFYSIQENSSGSYIEGVQQPIEIYATNTVDEKISDSKTLKIYPNPAMDLIKIDLSEGTSILNYQVYNSSGVLIEKGALGPYNYQIPVSKWTDGLYILVISSDIAPTQNYTYKIIKS